MSPVLKVIQPVGILDGTQVNHLRQEINNAVTASTDIVLIDLENVTFMDSSGLGALVIALKSVRSAGGKLFLCSINDQVKMLFQLTSMDRVFEIFPNRAEFNQAVLLPN
ncbi:MULTISPECIES: STAS domain-containing protein [Trichocoleus]|uniref:Anti-sigma factor antagonist n=1 Tax=Trichocoleus desertorum GB2-A4 TaxID=2933944 RepID=A0ABV0J8F4_9CYAN|nr:MULTISPECIES: STAS domain-containing protein [unclassified Trichocoleus]MBD1863522.1 STAS domain-containing protein [Trichocoleus sp. FACHB-46]MBD2099125.1 STAS domain-containing protein [Trichocoleus sp. FACHB-591]MBD2123895.1 STAS domain-containing protein [Trichocoleus sp. FACHB-262]